MCLDEWRGVNETNFLLQKTKGTKKYNQWDENTERKGRLSTHCPIVASVKTSSHPATVVVECVVHYNTCTQCGLSIFRKWGICLENCTIMRYWRSEMELTGWHSSSEYKRSFVERLHLAGVPSLRQAHIRLPCFACAFLWVEQKNTPRLLAWVFQLALHWEII